MVRRAQARLPLGFLGMIVLLIVSESLVASRCIDLATKMSLAWHRASEAAQLHAKHADLLCFGDSLSKLGVQPLVLESELGRSAYNLAVPGGQAPSTFFLLRNSLHAGAKPTAIIINYHENLLAIAPRFSGDAFPHLLDGRDWLDLTCHARDPGLAASTGLALMLPSFRFRVGLRESIIANLKGEPREMQEDLIALDRNWKVNAGAQVATPVEVPQTNFHNLDLSIPLNKKSKWSPHPVNLKYIYRLLDLSKDHNITVYWIIPPTSPNWTIRQKQVGTTDLYNRLLVDIQKKYKNLIVVEGRDSHYGHEVFVDDTHLDGRGAETLSRALAQTLSVALKNQNIPNWISLPVVDSVPAHYDLEDLTSSRQATAHHKASQFK